MPRNKIPGGNMTLSKAMTRWADVRNAAQSGDPIAMTDAVSRFEGIVDTFFMRWSTPNEKSTEQDKI